MRLKPRVLATWASTNREATCWGVSQPSCPASMWTDVDGSRVSTSTAAAIVASRVARAAGPSAGERAVAEAGRLRGGALGWGRHGRVRVVEPSGHRSSPREGVRARGCVRATDPPAPGRHRAPSLPTAPTCLPANVPVWWGPRVGTPPAGLPDRRGPDRRGPDRRGPDRGGPDRRGPDRWSGAHGARHRGSGRGSCRCCGGRRRRTTRRGRAGDKRLPGTVDDRVEVVEVDR